MSFCPRTCLPKPTIYLHKLTIYLPKPTIYLHKPTIYLLNTGIALWQPRKKLRKNNVQGFLEMARTFYIVQNEATSLPIFQCHKCQPHCKSLNLLWRIFWLPVWKLKLVFDFLIKSYLVTLLTSVNPFRQRRTHLIV